MSHVAEALNPDRLWVIHMGADDVIAERACDKGFIAIGWAAMPDLTPLETRDQVREAMTLAYPDWQPRRVSSSFYQLHNFAHEMREGDAVVFPVRPRRQIGIGRIAGPYRYADDDAVLVEHEYPHFRQVDWLRFVPRTAFTQPALHSFGAFTSVSRSDDHLDQTLAVLQAALTEETADAHPSPAVEDESDADEVELYSAAVQETEDFLMRAWLGSGTFFERVVGAVFEAMGYTATVTRRSGDHGVDVIAHPDPLGLEKPFVKVQAKSGSGATGEPDVNQLRGLLNPGEQGVFIALGGFTQGAQAVGRQSPDLRLIDGPKFVGLFLEHYERLEPAWQARFPLRRVHVPFQAS